MNQAELAGTSRQGRLFSTLLTNWTPTGAASSVLDSSAISTHYGGYAAMLGLTTPTSGDSSISSTFTAPTGATGLSFWYKMTCLNTITYDWTTAVLRDNTTSVNSTVLAKICVTNGWTQVRTGLTAGHNYSLTLTSHDDNYGADPTYTLFDDVVIAGGGNQATLAMTTATGTVTCTYDGAPDGRSLAFTSCSNGANSGDSIATTDVVLHMTGALATAAYSTAMVLLPEASSSGSAFGSLTSTCGP